MIDSHSNLGKSLARLYRRSASDVKPGLEVIRVLLEELGNPQRDWPSIHVAGTNGKGSVCAMLSSVLHTAGLKTGFYSSPHLVRYNERFRINDKNIPDDTLAGLLDEIEGVSAKVAKKPGMREATFFEISTALAYEYFRRERVDIAVIETGMGGIWDATNVITPLVSVITRIDWDHMNYLGNSLTAIAKEKAGIIKAGRPVVLGAMPSEARAVVTERARELNCQMVIAEEAASVRRVKQTIEGQKITIETTANSYGTVKIPFLGRHQMENCATAVAALDILDGLIPLELTAQKMKKGLEVSSWPGRCQVISKKPLVILDGAHNPNGAASLCSVLEEIAEGRPIGFVISFLADKDSANMLKYLKPLAKRSWTVEIKNERAMSLDSVTAVVRSAGLEPTPTDLADAVASAKKWADQENGVVVITGSLYLVGEVLGEAALS